MKTKQRVRNKSATKVSESKHATHTQTDDVAQAEHVEEHLSEPKEGQPLSPGTILKWQKRFGNAQVQRMLAQRTQNGRQPTKADPNHAGMNLSRLPVRGALIQRDLGGSFLMANGGFDVDLTTQQNVATTGGNFASGMFGTIKFLPDERTPYSNQIGLVQIVKLTDAGGANVNPGTLPPTTAPHVRTNENKLTGVEGGFSTDVQHNTATQGQAMPPYYKIGPSDVFGFKRSNNPDDMKAAVLQDFPGARGATTPVAGDFDFSFETVAKADDTLDIFGTVKWSFGTRGGNVIDEKLTVEEGNSATWEEALEKHRDFYVHEPVTFYFDFDSDVLNGTEDAKIDTFLDYLNRFPDVMLDLKGFADLRGNATYNRNLALRRANAVAQALISKGVSADRIKPLRLADMGGATTEFTKDAITDQDEEANRRGNRRVVLSFEHTASVIPGP